MQKYSDMIKNKKISLDDFNATLTELFQRKFVKPVDRKIILQTKITLKAKVLTIKLIYQDTYHYETMIFGGYFDGQQKDNKTQSKIEAYKNHFNAIMSVWYGTVIILFLDSFK